MTDASNNSEIRSQLVAILKLIAPEIEEQDLAAVQPLRNQVDLDSMDWLNFLVAVHEKLRVDIPEADYGKLVTLNDVAAYVRARMK